MQTLVSRNRLWIDNQIYDFGSFVMPEPQDSEHRWCRVDFDLQNPEDPTLSFAVRIFSINPATQERRFILGSTWHGEPGGSAPALQVLSVNVAGQQILAEVDVSSRIRCGLLVRYLTDAELPE